jgi:hypothetical protein
MSRTIEVIAAKGRRVPIHPRVATDVGGKLLIVGDQKSVVLPDVGYVRRRLRSGDLVEVAVKPMSKPVQTPAPTKES